MFYALMHSKPYYPYWMADLPLIVGDAILLGIVVVVVAVVGMILELILAPNDVDGDDVVIVIDVGIDADADVALGVVLVNKSDDTQISHILNYTCCSFANHDIGRSRKSISFT